jgi:YcaO-like protein with predicted kinase domain
MDLQSFVESCLHKIEAIDFFEASKKEIQDVDIDELVGAIEVTRIAATTQLDRLRMPTFYSVRPSALHPCAMYSSGKAFESRPALLSSVFEAYERWAAERPAFCIDASPSTLSEHSESWNLSVFEPQTTESTKSIKWALGRCLGSAQFAAVPACYVEFPPVVPADQRSTTTGLAAHASYAEAAKNALLECIERHHTAALTHSNIARVRAADFSRQATRLATTFEKEDIELHTFVISPSSHVKTVYCYAYDHWLGVPQIHCSGFGASTRLEAAVEKAMLEVVQSRAAMISGLRADVAELAPLWRDNYLENSEHLAWLEKLRLVQQVFDAAWLGPEPTDTLCDVLASIASNDVTPLIFPLRMAAGFPAVRVFIPELNDCC